MIEKNLRVLMAESNLNIQEVSNKTGLSRTTISNLVNGYSKGIQFDTITKLCEVLKCKPTDLFNGVD